MIVDAVDMKRLLGRLAEGHALDRTEAETAFRIMMSGDATPSQMGALLMALRMRGETVDEITGAATVMRSRALTIDAPEGAVDVVGTGGDGHGTYNVSTAAAFVVAGAGVPVAKHGNRAFSSRSGAADTLTALGVDIDADMGLVRRALWEAHIAFLMAPRHHSATRHVAGTRVELGTRTIFNILGPLSNPANVKRLLVGTYASRWVEPMAQVLGNLGAERAWVVHGEDGLDEISTTGPTLVAEWHEGRVRTFTLSPEEVGLSRVSLADLKGGEPKSNAEALAALLRGERGPYRDIVVFNAGAALVVAGVAATVADGIEMASASIDGGKAGEALVDLVSISNGGDPA